MKANIMVYPYRLEFYPIISNRDLLINASIKYLLAPKGFGLDRLYADYFSNSSKQEYRIDTNLTKNILEGSDTTWILDIIDEMQIENVKSVLTIICQYHKKIIYSGERNTEIFKLVESCSLQYGCKIYTEYEFFKKDKAIQLNEVKRKNECSVINTPIITVMSDSLMSQKLDIELNIKSQFEKKGYVVSYIGSERSSEAVGGYSIKRILFDKKITEIDKIHQINALVKRIEEVEEPDVIVFGVPDVILPLSNKQHFSYGIYAYEVFQAINATYTILALSNGAYNDDFFNEMQSLCNYRFQTDIDSFYISKYFPTSNSMQSQELSYAYAENQNMEVKNNIVYYEDCLQSNILSNDIEKKLLKYGQYNKF